MPVQSPLVAIVAITSAFVGSACSRTHPGCPPAPRGPSVDSLNASAPVRFYSDSSVPRDSIVGMVIRAGARSPVQNADVRLRPDTTVRDESDSMGRFALPLPAVNEAVVEIRRLGYISRRDTVRVGELRGKRLELTLFDAYALGDIEPVCVQVRH